MTHTKINNNVVYLLLLLTFSACSPTRNLVYFSNLKNTSKYSEGIKNKTEPKIQPDDLLSITVSTLNPESNILFNGGFIQPIGSVGNSASAEKMNEGYLVDKDGNINFPVIGSVKLAGLTKEQATDKMVSEIKQQVKNPIVNVRFLNFKITVIGEVNRPATINIPTEKVNLVEALSRAGDLTPFGKRSNLLIIREEEGIRSMVRVNLNDKDILSSPYYYLHQNDILYVEPVKVRALQGNALMIFVPLITVAVSVLSLLIISR
jgi:polysaccharide export outer membrane protein